MKHAFYFSIIVPYCKKYDVYFNDCIQSLVTQICDLDEIIIISSRDENDYLKKYENKNNIQVILSDFTDQSHNRNIGINVAKNEYIIFVDCDDVLSKDYLLIAKKIINKHNPDIILFNFTRNIDFLNKNDNDIIYKNEKRDLLSIFYSQYSNTINVINAPLVDSVCSKVFKKSIITSNKIKFEEKTICAEDALFVRDYALYINSAAIANNIYAYYWRYNPNSTMNVLGDFFNINVFAKHLNQTLKKLPKEYSNDLNNYLIKVLLDRISSLIPKISVIKEWKFLLLTYNSDSYIIMLLKQHKKIKRPVKYLVNNRKFSLLLYLSYRKIRYKIHLILKTLFRKK